MLTVWQRILNHNPSPVIKFTVKFFEGGFQIFTEGIIGTKHSVSVRVIISIDTNLVYFNVSLLYKLFC